MARERALRVDKKSKPPQKAVTGAHAKVTPPAPPAKPRNLRVASKRERTKGLVPKVQLRAYAANMWERVKALAVRARAPGLTVLRALSVLAALAGAVAVGRLVQHHLTTSPAFAIDKIEIRGLSRIEREELLEAAGIDLGTNVFAHSPDEVRAKLLRHPWVASATVQRSLPSRFDLDIREREPVALLLVEACAPEADRAGNDPSCDDPSSLYLVSDEATVFKRLEGEDPVDLPVITGIDRQRFGTDREREERVLREAVALLSEYRSAGLWKRLPIGEMHVERTDAISLYVGEELTHVRLGNPPFGPKLRRMKKVFDRLEREKASAEYVYLDNELRPDRVTVRLR